MSNMVIENDFPVWGLLPKKETEVLSFLTKYPEYDGRGIIIAILDSGVDPGAPGLQLTSEGDIKVLERFDCSGCGDVTTTTVLQAKNGYLTGLTGRKLKVPDTWKNPSNCYRLGVKNAFNLYPERLRERIQEERKEKLWEHQHKTALAEASRLINKFEAKHSTGTNLNEEEKWEKENLEANLEVLANSDKKYVDLGPTYDCILYHDGDKWMACIDTTEKGELEKCPLLGEYSVTHEFAPLTESDQLNFSINVHDDGNILELVGLCSSHGTHVASIASAYFADCPEKNGVAPGAQIVSLTIGDGRLGSMETGTALVRAMIKVMELNETKRVHVINMSYGEHPHWSNTGRIGELMTEIVNKYGIVWVASAGNHGPALSTIGTPPDINQDVIVGVGAYVSPDMMIAEYSMRQKLTGMPYTWSSRGPTIDGGFGVSICAPGGAITSVPNFTLRNSQLMNGTSMASPHVAGAVAIILSGLEQIKLPYSPYSIKRALENCACVLKDVEPFAQGSGLLQIDKSFEFLVSYHNVQERDVRFHISCGSHNAKGIYIRSKPQHPSQEFSINVEPFFKDSDKVDAQTKIQFNIKLALVCKEPYVSHPSHLDIANMARVFAVKVQTSDLPHGIHSTSIDAFDISCIARGPVFRIPITVIKPVEVNTTDYTNEYPSVTFKPNTIQRHYFTVPENATWGIIRLRSTEANANGRFVLHCMQILPRQSCKSLETNKNLTVTSGIESIQSFQVRGGVVLEVVVAKYWANLGEMTLNYSISFHGIKPTQPYITMQAADGIHSLEVISLRGEELLPNISVKNSVQILKPNESKVCPLTKRDVLPPGRQIYELQLTYLLHLTKATEVSPNNALLSDVLYESEFESQLWMLYDSNKQLLGCGDAYPSKYSIKLDKGDYTIKLHIRHDKKEYLEKLTEIPMLISQKLPAAIPLDIYASQSQALIGGKKATQGHTVASCPVPIYIAPLAADKFNAKVNNNAHYLTGYITYAKDELGKKVDSYPVKYVLYESNKKLVKPVDKDKSKYDEYKESLRDLKTSWLSKMDVRSTAQTLYQEICAEFPDHLAAHTSLMQSLDAMEPRRQLPLLSEQDINNQNREDIIKVINICDKILENINQDSLLSYFAIKNDQRADATKIKSVMERARNILLDCLCRKGIALCRLYKTLQINTEEIINDKCDISLEIVSNVWKTLLKFVDPYDNKFNSIHVLYFAMWHAAAYNHHGRLLKFLLKLQEEKPVRELDEKYIEVCSLLEWTHLELYLRNALPSKYPTTYKPF